MSKTVELLKAFLLPWGQGNEAFFTDDLTEYVDGLASPAGMDSVSHCGHVFWRLTPGRLAWLLERHRKRRETVAKNETLSDERKAAVAADINKWEVVIEQSRPTLKLMADWFRQKFPGRDIANEVVTPITELRDHAGEPGQDSQKSLANGSKIAVAHVKAIDASLLPKSPAHSGCLIMANPQAVAQGLAARSRNGIQDPGDKAILSALGEPSSLLPVTTTMLSDVRRRIGDFAQTLD